MAISFVGADSWTAAGSSSYILQKPSAGVAAGDYLVAIVALDLAPGGVSASISTPSGWTKVDDFRSSPNLQIAILTRIATASEPGSWTGTLSAVIQELCSVVSVYRGVSGIAVSGRATVGSAVSFHTATINNPTNNNWRIVAASYTSASKDYALATNEVSERDRTSVEGATTGAVEAGIWDSNGSIATGNTFKTVSRGQIWESAASWIAALDASDVTASGDLAATVPLVVFSGAMSQEYSGTMAASIPQLVMTADGLSTAPSGVLATVITPVVSMVGASTAKGTFAAAITPVFRITAETRRFGIRVTAIDSESRTVTPLLGADTVSPLAGLVSLFVQEVVGGDLFRAALPLPQVDASGDITPASQFEATLPLPEVLFTGSDSNIYVIDYATPQLAANAASGKRLVFPASQTYTATSLLIPANCYVEGNGSTLKYPDNSTSSTSLSDEILKVNGSGVTIDNLNFDGRSLNQGATWSQFRHCIRIQGTFSNVVVKNCDFANMIGDGVYVNTSTGSNNKVGPNNTFTAQYDNRNGVSVITGTNIEVYSNSFTNCTRTGMPGPIDIEPNLSTETLLNVLVHDNTIVGGSTTGTGTIPGIVYGGFQNAAADNIQIYNNDISGVRFTSGVLAIGISGGPFNRVTNLDIYGNNIHGIGNSPGIGVNLSHYIGADVYNNTLNGMTYGIYNYHACLGTSTGNTFTGVYANITNDAPQCS